MLKKILKIIGIILLIFIVFIGYFVIVDLNQEKKLKNEIIQINDMLNATNPDYIAINQKLAITITKNDYAKLERSYKKYLKDILENIMVIKSILEDERITHILSADNYIEDGPDFLKTKKYLDNTQRDLSLTRDKYYELLTIEKAMSYLDNQNLDDYYLDFYQKEMISDIETGKNDKTIETSVNIIITLLNESNKVIDFLIENNGSWVVDNNNIIFNSEALTNQYNNLLLNILNLDGKDVTFSKGKHQTTTQKYYDTF